MNTRFVDLFIIVVFLTNYSNIRYSSVSWVNDVKLPTPLPMSNGGMLCTTQPQLDSSSPFWNIPNHASNETINFQVVAYIFQIMFCTP